MYFYTSSGVTEAEVWTEDSEGYSDFQIVTEIWVEPQCGYVQMPMQSTAMYLHPLQYHQLPDAVSTIADKNFDFLFIHSWKKCLLLIHFSFLPCFFLLCNIHEIA
jgi:hypothetical protein